MNLGAALACLTKRAILFVTGFILAFPLAGLAAYTNGRWVQNTGWEYQFDLYSLVLAAFLFICGMLMMIHAYRKRECGSRYPVE